MRGNELGGEFRLRYCHNTDGNDFYVSSLDACIETAPIAYNGNASDVHTALSDALAELFNVSSVDAADQISVARNGGGGYDSSARPREAGAW